jgi:ribosomal protein L37AE/L43A
MPTRQQIIAATPWCPCCGQTLTHRHGTRSWRCVQHGSVLSDRMAASLMDAEREHQAARRRCDRQQRLAAV